MGWSTLLPGFGQLYNRDYILGFTVLVLEVVINVIGNINRSIYFAFNGDFAMSHQVLNYQWALFYPSIYAYSIWQAFNYAERNNRMITEPEALKKEPSDKHTGFYIGFAVGMTLGTIWSFLGSPVIGALIGGAIGGISGTLIEKIIKSLCNIWP